MAVDVLVAGGGLAALTAGLFAARHGLSTLVLEPRVPGGQLVNVERVEDYPGFPDGVPGFDLGPIVQEQAAAAGAAFRLAEVLGLARGDGAWLVRASDGEVAAGAVIVASGSRPRALGVPGEARLSGRGVSHCASCDGPLFRGRPVAVVGGGDSALQEALTVAQFASEVVLIHRRDAFRAQRVYVDRVAGTPTIRPRMNRVVEEIVGAESVGAVRVRDRVSGVAEEIEVAGVFVYVGTEPNTGFLREVVALDPDGRVPVDAWMRAKAPGLFAAGDVRRDFPGQAVNAAGDGATAAIAAHRYLQAGG
ncbi:MAG TPA: FAD-dependent oxidoreductase [Chloroflexota bacterium]|nr:FAD-dependent oxidoreductase [Chloroflexota bacterium]